VDKYKCINKACPDYCETYSRFCGSDIEPEDCDERIYREEEEITSTVKYGVPENDIIEIKRKLNKIHVPHVFYESDPLEMANKIIEVNQNLAESILITLNNITRGN